MGVQLTKNCDEDSRTLSERLEWETRVAGEYKNLTRRERDVLDQLSKGFRYKEIVANLGISQGTLNTYISSVYKKLQVHSRTEAVVKYLVQRPAI